MNIPENMQAVRLERKGGSLVLCTMKVPRPKQGEVLLKMLASPVNPSDIMRVNSISPGQDLNSFIPGIEGSGRVIAAGKGLLPAMWMGKRVACSAYHPESGTWAEYMVAPASLCFPLPRAVSDEQGSMLLVNPMTAVAFFDIIKKEKHKAVINSAAAGALGAMIRILGKKNNIPVINVVRNELQEHMLLENGDKHVLKNSDTDFTDKLRLLSHELKATLALDPISGSYTQQLLDAIPYGGTIVLYGNLSGGDEGTTLRPLLTDNKKLHGFYLANWMKENGLIRIVRNISRVRQLLKNDFKVTIQNRFPLDKAQLVVDTYLNNMTGGKVLLMPKGR
jgi:NADPH2:quinone reductase